MHVISTLTALFKVTLNLQGPLQRFMLYSKTLCKYTLVLYCFAEKGLQSYPPLYS